MKITQNSFVAIALLMSSVSYAQTDILLTDFQTGMPSSYTIVDNDGLNPDPQVSEFNSAWIIVEDPENPLDSVAASTSFFSPTGTASRWLITPPLALGTFGNFVSWSAKSQDAAYPDSYLVLVSTTDNALSSFTDTIGEVIEENFEWTDRDFYLSGAGYNAQTIYIAFVNNTEDGFKLYIDDIRVWKDDPASVEEMNATEVHVYPNPASDFVTIKTTTPVINVELIAPNGQIILSENKEILNLSGLLSGVYYLRIQTEMGVVTKKLIKL